MNIRKLFQTSNQPADCLYFCDSTCPNGCYAYVDLDYYTPPPSPPPPPPQTSNKHHQNISPYVIISVALFASLFLLVSYYLIIVKNCFNWYRRRRTTQSQSSDEEFFDENRGPIIDHPIWYIDTVGLQPSVIDMITIYKFSKGNSLIEGTTNCSVCLNEFQVDESFRLLPTCKHAFHVNCIDTWLRSHTNCPLCRAGIVTNEGMVSENDEVNGNNEVIEREFRQNDEERLQIECLGTSKKEVQIMRRSASVDSSISTGIGLEEIGENSNSGMNRMNKEAVLMKRSLSYGGRSFFSRYQHSSSSVLPL